MWGTKGRVEIYSLFNTERARGGVDQQQNDNSRQGTVHMLRVTIAFSLGLCLSVGVSVGV